MTKAKNRKSSVPKLFIYTDDSAEICSSNVFLAGRTYKDVTEFRKQNPGFSPLISYKAKDIYKILKKEFEKEKK